jgi:soluble P-type ATPase
MDPKLLALMGDRRFKCFVSMLKGKGCDMLNVDQERLLAGDEQEKEKIYRFLPELDKVRKSGYDIVGRFIELANKLRSENVSDLAVAVGIMLNVMFGREISPEDARKVGSVIDAIKCVNFDEDGVSVDYECLEKADVPEELKKQIGMVTMANLVWSA